MAKLKCLNCGELFSADIKDHEHVTKPCPKCKSKFVRYFCADDVKTTEKVEVTQGKNFFDLNKFMKAFSQS